MTSTGVLACTKWFDIRAVARGSASAALAVSLVLVAHAARAHTPHDMIEALAVSPDYGNDRTVYIIVRQNLMKSVDGGRTYGRLVNGIDNRGDLSSLDLSAQSKRILFLASRGDGIYKSENEGASWAKVNVGLENLDIRLVAISPRSADLVVAIGAGKEIFTTTDGGKRWRKAFDAPAQPTALAFLPGAEGERIVVGDERGTLYESQDLGESWSEVRMLPGAGAIRAIAGSPDFASDRTFFVGTEKAGVFRTADGGASFAPVNDGLADPSVMSLAVSPAYATDATLFASTWHGGVFAFDAREGRWERLSEGLTKDPQSDDFGQPHFTSLEPSGTYAEDGTMFLAAFDGLFTTTDRGETWSQLDVLPAHIIVGLAISPNYGNDSTVALSEYFGRALLSTDKGATWRYINRDVRGRCDSRFFPRFRKFDIAFAPDYPADPRIFTATWWGILQTTVGARSWEGFGIEGVGVEGKSKGPLPLPKIAFSPAFATDQTMFAGTRHGEIFLSTDSGRSFSMIADLGRGIRALVVSPGFPSDGTLFAVTEEGIERSTDRGRSWHPARRGVAVARRADIRLVISPNYASDRTLFAGTPEGLFATTDGGESWRRLEGALFGGSRNIVALDISQSFATDRTLIVNAKGKGPYLSEDGGESFTPIGRDLIQRNLSPSATDPFTEESFPLQLSPSFAKDRTIFGFSRTTLLRSDDGGKTWTESAAPPLDYGVGSFLHCMVALNDKRRFATALLAGLAGYFLIGFVGFGERSLFGRWPHRTLGSIAIFGVAVALLQL